MRLFHFPLSSNGRRVTLTAAHLGLPLEIVPIDLTKPDDRRRLTELNLNNKAPVLEDDGFLLWESCAIMQYLADSVPGQTVYPQAKQARADVNRWMFWACQHFAPALNVIAWENVWKGFAGRGATDPVELARGETELARFASVLDQHLDGRDWVVGEGVTLADFALAAPLMYRAKARQPVGHYANLMRWFKRVQELPAWQATNPQKP
jgi:glutathione S-transferase